MTIILNSPAFKDMEKIPVKYTCHGEDISPPLNWYNSPVNTSSYVLIVDDPDSHEEFAHWLIYNIPHDATQLAEGISRQQTFPDGISQGVNDYGHIGYIGPCPPEGNEHHYRFTIYALNKELNLKPGITKESLLNAIEDHIIDHYQLTGLFHR